MDGTNPTVNSKILVTVVSLTVFTILGVAHSIGKEVDPTIFGIVTTLVATSSGINELASYMTFRTDKKHGGNTTANNKE
jgi:hypothetical protein